jgi:molybdopterin/thiamine biosynthesis adenylyltransferase
MEARWVGGDTAFEVALVPVGLPAVDERLPTSLVQRAKTAKVGIVGLGSIGSKVVTSLARSGVRSFVLVDGDVLLPENVVRHDTGFLAAGMLKVEAARERITSVASEPCDIRTYHHAVADASNATIHAQTLDALASVDVIVDATANPDAFNTLAWLASDARRPLVWGELFAGGFGGLIGFAHPTLTPCPSCVRGAFLAHADSWPPAPRSDSGAPYAGTHSDRPTVATDADVTVIAGLVTSTVLDTIEGSLDHRSAVTLLGLREGWIFDRPLDTRSIPVRADDFSCPWCWTAPADPDPDVQEIVERLLATQTNAQNPPQP